MKQIFSDVWETDTESPFPGLTTHAYLLIRDGGNVLFYNTGHRYELDRIEALGGVQYQFLSHRDELGDTVNAIRERFGARLGGHLREKEDFARVRVPDILFDRREFYLDDIEVIPTPGHSPGSTCFVVHTSHGKRYLFTGDTLYLDENGTWKPGLLPNSDRQALTDSLEILQKLEPDAVFSSAFAGDAGFQDHPTDWAGQVGRALALLREETGNTDRD